MVAWQRWRRAAQQCFAKLCLASAAVCTARRRGSFDQQHRMRRCSCASSARPEHRRMKTSERRGPRVGGKGEHSDPTQRPPPESNEPRQTKPACRLNHLPPKSRRAGSSQEATPPTPRSRRLPLPRLRRRMPLCPTRRTRGPPRPAAVAAPPRARAAAGPWPRQDDPCVFDLLELDLFDDTDPGEYK